MAGIFDGTSFLYTANHLVGATPAYPVLMLAKVKAANTTGLKYFFSVSDNAAFAALDGLFVGQSTTNVRAFAMIGGGVSANSDQPTVTANTWLTMGAVFRANNDRSSILGTTPDATPSLTHRAATGLSHACIGAAYYDTAADSPFSGRIAEAVFASGFTIGDLATILTAYDGGARAISIAELSPYINAYQPLWTGLNDSGYVGPAWTNASVTFDSGDHPINYRRPQGGGAGFDFSFGFGV